MSERLVLYNFEIADARRVRNETNSQFPELEVRNGREHGLDPFQWVELILQAPTWTRIATEALQAIGNDTRAAIVGILATEIINRVKKKYAKQPQTELAKIVKLLKSSGADNLVLTLVSETDLTTSIRLAKSTEGEIASSIFVLGCLAQEIHKHIDSAPVDVRRYGWVIEIKPDVILLRSKSPSTLYDDLVISLSHESRHCPKESGQADQGNE